MYELLVIFIFFWVIFGTMGFVIAAVREDNGSYNKKQYAFLIFLGGPIIWGLITIFILIPYTIVYIFNWLGDEKV